MLKFDRNLYSKLKNFFSNFITLSSKGNFDFVNFQKLISKKFKIPVLSVRYSYDTRYIEQASALPSRWSKSFFRETFAKNKGKFAEVASLKTQESFFLNEYDFALCLSDKERVSVEISYGNIEVYNFEKIKRYIKKKINYISNGIIFLHTSTYNIWHHYVEMISILNHFILKFKENKKKIYIPYNKDSLKILKLLKIEDKVEFFENKKLYYTKNCEFISGIFDEVLPVKSLDLCKNKILKSIYQKKKKDNFKNIFISRGDYELNRRNLINEKNVIRTISKKFKRLKIFKPGLGDVNENIYNMINSKNIFSLMGTQLYFNSLFSKKPKKIFEIVGENYRGFTVGELVSRYLKCKYIRMDSKNITKGYSIYVDQIAKIRSLKRKLNYEKS